MAQFVFSPAIASVGIDVETMPVITAPAPIYLTARDHAGFSSFEGTGAIYDGAAHEIYHVWTVREQPLPNFGRPQNFLAEWNNANVAYGKSVTFRATVPGDYVIDLWCVDRNGVTAVASTSTITVVDADTAYPGAQTICYSEDPGETWQGEFPGARRVTDWAALSTAVRGDQSNGPNRILFKAGATIEPPTTLQIDSGRGLSHVGVWGSGDKPILRNLTKLSAVNMIRFAGGVQNAQFTVNGIRFEGGWDSTREVGYITPAPIFWRDVIRTMHYHIHDCEWSGFDNWGVTTQTDAPDAWITVSDCFATNWCNYAMFSGGGVNNRLAILGNRFQQHVDALNGVLGKGGVGNQHGPVRISRSKTAYIACTDFFARGGWSGGINNVNGFSEPADQPCLRLFTSGEVGDSAYLDRIVCEGGYHNIKLSSFGVGDTVNPANIVVDRALLMGTAKATSEMIYVGHGGVTIRNVIGIVPNVPRRQNNDPDSLIRLRYQTARGAGNEDHSQVVHNSTGVYLRSSGPGFVLAEADVEWSDVTFGQNLAYAPNISTPVTGQPIDLSQTFAGITPRYKGVRFNFAPLSFGPGDSNLPEAALAIGASFVVPYAAITDMLVGGNPALASATDQAYWQQMEADSAAAGYTPRHTLQARGGGIRYTELGEFTVAYEATGIRFTNTSDGTWALPVDANLPWLIRLDRSVNIPGILAQYASPATVMRPTSDAQDAGLPVNRPAPSDFLLAPRGDTISVGALLP